MFSVVVVYNKEQTLNRILLPSLKEQTAEYEFIPIDNTRQVFKSAAEALNFGGRMAKGKYILFAHQDIELGSKTWLRNTEIILDTIPDLGIAGVAGMDIKGNKIGYMCNCGEDWGKPFVKPQEAQTLDECLLIIPQQLFRTLQFDMITFDGWHSYGCDYSLRVQEHGMKAYVIPAYAYHRHLLTVDTRELPKYHKRLYHKHREWFSRIYTTCGTVTNSPIPMSQIKKPLKLMHNAVCHDWLRTIKKGLADCESVLDLGCGYNSPLQFIDVPRKVGVELFDPYLEESQKKEVHNEYIKSDIRTLVLSPKSYDAVFCSEVLEHLTKEEGKELLQKMDKWTKKSIILTTPNGYIYQDDYDKNPYQEHKSGWSASELRDAGFKVRGMNGLKYLRGYKGQMKYKPTVICRIVSTLSQIVTQYYPRFAFQLLAVKKLG